MKIGQEDIDKLGWFGAKRVAAAFLGSKFVNPFVRFVGQNLLPARIVQKLPLALSHVTFRLADGQTIRLLDPRRDIVARDIHWGGTQPTSPAECLKMRCIELLASQTSVFLDVGAYSGVCALAAARSNPEIRAICYEIVPENFLLLVRNILENDLAVRVEARLRGIGAEVGVVRLPTSIGLPSNPTSMSIGSTFSEGAAISIVTLDAETAEMTGPFLLKIDVEGYEVQVLKGAATFIAGNRPNIICEVLPDAFAACEAIEAQLGQLGYRWLVFEDGGLRTSKRLSPGDQPRDWLLSAQSDIEQLVGRLN